MASSLDHLLLSLLFLQRNDIAMAITKFDQFDFLIDIVPRDELKPPKRQVGKHTARVVSSLALCQKNGVHVFKVVLCCLENNYPTLKRWPVELMDHSCLDC